MQKLEQLYEGKAKKVFRTDDPELYIVDYKDDATAFDGAKKGTIVGKGVIKSLRRAYPEANIVAVDYDPGASEVNQLNRIKLMISVAKENMRAGKGFKLEKVAPLAMDEVTGQMRAHDGCVSCGSVDESAVASVAERLGRGVK